MNPYDSIIRSVEPGIIMSINQSYEYETETPEFTVEKSETGETHLVGRTDGGVEFRVHKEDTNELYVYKVTSAGEERLAPVVTIEIQATS